MSSDNRIERLQLMLTETELQMVDDWRFKRRMPSRSAAVRELLKRGLVAEGFALSDPKAKSADFGLAQTEDDDEAQG